MAGHAIMLMKPTIGSLRAMSKAMPKRVGSTDQLVCPLEKRRIVEEARFASVFPSAELESWKLPENEVRRLQTWHVASEDFYLDPFGVDGTVPSSVVLNVRDPEKRAKIEADVRLDDRAFARTSPNVFRGIQIMHVGGKGSHDHRRHEGGSDHRFYLDVVEVTLPRTSPLYSNDVLRGLGVAASQWVLSRQSTSETIDAAGATPRDLVMEEYEMTPVVSIDAESGRVMDTASRVAAHDVMPPRPAKPIRLNALQTSNLNRSLDAIGELSSSWRSTAAAEGTTQKHANIGISAGAGWQKHANTHCVAYEVAYATLVHNPSAVKHFTDKMLALGTTGTVDRRLIEGLSDDEHGKEAGWYVSINAYVPI